MTCARCGALLPNVTSAETMCKECQQIMVHKTVQVPCSPSVRGTAGTDAFALYKEVMEELKTVKADDLRDQFAMAALSGLLASYEGTWNSDSLSREAYRIADAMIKERDK